MSRTRKDKPWKLIYEPYWKDRYLVPLEDGEYFHRYLFAKTTKPKKKRGIHTEWDYIHGTPSWWNNLFHTRPIRGNFRKFSRDVVTSNLEEVEWMLEPSDSKSPHKYYW